MTTYTYSVSLEFPSSSDDGSYFFNSEDFYTKRDARKCYKFLQSLDIPSTTIRYLKTKCLDTCFTDEMVDNEMDEDFTIEIENDNDSDNHTPESHDLSSMAFFPYGKGFILKPHKTSEHYAEKYFMNGYWIDAARGWFFRKNDRSFIEDMGARYVPKRIKTVAETAANTSVNTPTNKLSNTSDSQITWKPYGKGYLLVPTSSSYKNYGQKYFHGGFWMPKHNAWFFKKDAYNTYNSQMA